MNNKLDAYNKRRQHETTRKTKTSPYGKQARKQKIHNQPCRYPGCWNTHIEYHHIIPISKLPKNHPAIPHPHNAMPLCHTHHQNHHTTTKRIPQEALTPEELHHAIQHTTHTWVNKWYPQTTSPPIPQCNNQCNCANPQTCEFNNQNQN